MDSKNQANTMLVVFLVCLVCSIFVATAAIVLKPLQVRNAILNQQRIILSISGILKDGDSSSKVEELFKSSVKSYIIDMRTKTIDTSNKYATDDVGHILTRSDDTSILLTKQQDLAGIKRLEDFAAIYVVNDQQSPNYQETEDTILIVPIRGYGLWSTMYGYLALVMGNINTNIRVKGIDFYEHGETPGLGGEIDNQKWKDTWNNKRVYSRGGVVQLSVVKVSTDAVHQVDGLAGATLTSRGVDGAIKFWLGKHGFYDVIKLFYKKPVSKKTTQAPIVENSAEDNIEDFVENILKEIKQSSENQSKANKNVNLITQRQNNYVY